MLNHLTGSEPSGLLTDGEIIKLLDKEENSIVFPYLKKSVRQEPMDINGVLTNVKIISRGISTVGYDITAGDKWFVRTPDSTHVDPKNGGAPLQQLLPKEGPTGSYVWIPGNSTVFGETLEYFRMPENIMGLCIGKSTYARCGVNQLITPIEPGWHGRLTLEIQNANPVPAKLYIGEGVCQVLFFRTAVAPLISYAAKGGKYQGDKGFSVPKM